MTTTDPMPEPDPDATPEQTAADLVTHSLLGYLHDTDADARSRRIDRVLDAITEPPPTGAHIARRAALALLASGAFLALVVVFTNLGSVPTATAQVERSIAALTAPGIRRFEVFLLTRINDQPQTRTAAIIDARSPDLLLVQHNPPWSESTVFVGRDTQGEWAIDDTGRITRDRPRRFFPPWSVDDQTLLVDSVDRTLSMLTDGYTIERVTDDPRANDTGLACIRATRTRTTGPLPDTVTLWIDRATNLPERIELAWNHAPERKTRPGPPPLHSIILQRAPDPDLPAGWFDPATHARP